MSVGDVERRFNCWSSGNREADLDSGRTMYTSYYERSSSMVKRRRAQGQRTEGREMMLSDGAWCLGG